MCQRWLGCRLARVVFGVHPRTNRSAAATRAIQRDWLAVPGGPVVGGMRDRNETDRKGIDSPWGRAQLSSPWRPIRSGACNVMQRVVYVALVLTAACRGETTGSDVSTAPRTVATSETSSLLPPQTCRARCQVDADCCQILPPCTPGYRCVEGFCLHRPCDLKKCSALGCTVRDGEQFCIRPCATEADCERHEVCDGGGCRVSPTCDTTWCNGGYGLSRYPKAQCEGKTCVYPCALDADCCPWPNQSGAHCPDDAADHACVNGRCKRRPCEPSRCDDRQNIWLKGMSCTPGG